MKGNYSERIQIVRINFDVGTAIGQNSLRINSAGMGKSLERLSTGLRVNRASDDAAGLSVSEQMRTQIRGTAQAKRNAEDATAMLQIAEGAMNEIHSLLQRGREIAVQAANDTLTDEDRTYLQQENAALLEEMGRISDSTQYNGKQILNGGVDGDLATSITAGLQESWLAAAESLVNTHYGLSGDGRNLDIIIESNGAGGTVAYVSGSYGADGIAVGDLELHIDADDFAPGYDAVTNQSGGTPPYTADRIIGHEMVHAIMATSTGNTNLPTWFTEGAAEYLVGAEERLWGSIGGTKSNTQGVIDNNNLSSSGWNGTSDAYSIGYLGVRVLEDELITAGSSMMDLMTGLSDGSYADLNTAIIGEMGGANTLTTFQNAFNSGSGQAYIDATGDIDGTGSGAINRLNATAAAVVPDSPGGATEDPLSNFTEVWKDVATPLQMQIGANNVVDVDTIEASISAVTAEALGVSTANVSTNVGALGAIALFDSGIEQVSTKRSDVGSLVNRLAHAIENLSNQNFNQQDGESRIRDADFSKESTMFSRNQILTQSATSMLSQANGNKSMILNLLG